MDSNLLKVFVSVADNGSLSAASRELHCVQSNVTARIKQLEEKAGRPLFHRKPRGVVLTKAGEILYEYASDIVRKLAEAEQSMKHLDQSGSLKIGSTESNAAVRLTRILVELHKTYPDISFTLLTGTSWEITDLLLDYQVDVAFVSRYPDHPDLKILRRYEEIMVLIESALGPIPDVVLGFRQGCAYREFLEDYMTRMGTPDFRTMEFGSLDTILGCVAAGMGRAIVPLKIVEKLGDMDQLNIIRLPKSQEVIPTFMICRKDAVPMILKDLFDVNIRP
ncbi:MAG: LysR family transcriptional regulator [Desulfobacter sp.]